MCGGGRGWRGFLSTGQRRPMAVCYPQSQGRKRIAPSFTWPLAGGAPKRVLPCEASWVVQLSPVNHSDSLWTFGSSSFKIPQASLPGENLEESQYDCGSQLLWLSVRASPDTHHSPPVLLVLRFSSPTVSISDWLVTYLRPFTYP